MNPTDIYWAPEPGQYTGTYKDIKINKGTSATLYWLKYSGRNGINITVIQDKIRPTALASLGSWLQCRFSGPTQYFQNHNMHVTKIPNGLYEHLRNISI